MVNLSDRRILITGSEGFIGARLAEQLHALGAKVTGIDLRSGFDLTDWNRFQDLEGVEIVYHLAAIMFIPFALKNPREVYKVNVQGTLNVLEYCRKNDVGKLIFASSYVYGPPRYLPVDELHSVNPTNPYTRSKLIGEDLCRGYYEDHGLKCIIFRPFNIYGPGQTGEFLIPSIFKQITENNRVELKDPEPKRDFLYISDMVDAYRSAGEYEKTEFEIFNIGYGKSYSVEEIMDVVIKLINRKIEVKYTGERRANEIMDTVANISKAKKELNWQPKVDLKTGFKFVMDSQ